MTMSGQTVPAGLEPPVVTFPRSDGSPKRPAANHTVHHTAICLILNTKSLLHQDMKIFFSKNIFQTKQISSQMVILVIHPPTLLSAVNAETLGAHRLGSSLGPGSATQARADSAAVRPMAKGSFLVWKMFV